MTLAEALYVRVGAVLLAAAVPLSTLVVVAAVEALVAVPAIAVGETTVRPTEVVAVVAVYQLAARLYRLNVGDPAGSG
ncbi:hypothetical protein [Natronomonas amylolytica]|uniref:hypothetical protein n=1 Tax=Natronomonas amylolytica TaxID=3108498 RepID=UPI00300BB4F8